MHRQSAAAAPHAAGGGPPERTAADRSRRADNRIAVPAHRERETVRFTQQRAEQGHGAVAPQERLLRCVVEEVADDGQAMGEMSVAIASVPGTSISSSCLQRRSRNGRIIPRCPRPADDPGAIVERQAAGPPAHWD